MFSIIHINDLHSHLENWDLIKRYLQSAKDQALNQGETLLLIDTGDAIDKVHPLVDATGGSVMVDLFNEIGIDYVTIGNNEGLNLSPEQLEHIYQARKFKVVLSNLHNLNHEPPSWARPIEYMTVDSIQIALLGITAPYPTYALNGYQILNPIEALQQQLRTLDKPTDFVILLSHVGIEMDTYIAEHFPEIDLILGGHTHHLLVNGRFQSGTLLSANEKFGRYLTRINVERDDAFSIWHMDAETIALTDLQRKYYQSENFDDYYQRNGERLLEMDVITTLDEPLRLTSVNEQIPSFIEFTMASFESFTKADFALLYSGLFLKELNSGEVTAYDLHQALPHSIRAMHFELTGSEVIQLMSEIQRVEKSLVNRSTSGFGFRGKCFGQIYVSHLSFDQDWYYDQSRIQPDKIYRLVTTDHIYYLNVFPLLNQVRHQHIHFPDIMREIVRKYLKD